MNEDRTRQTLARRMSCEARSIRTAVLVCAALALMLAAACSDTDAPACPDGTDPWVKYELFMGRGNQSGEVVDDAAWDAFLADTVTPRFPDGLTVLDARGQWRNSEGLVQKERSKLLVVLAPPGGGEMRLIDEVTGEYKRRFGQEFVLKVVYDARVSFS